MTLNQEVDEIIGKIIKDGSISLRDLPNNDLIIKRLFDLGLDLVIRQGRLKMRDEKMKYDEILDLLDVLYTVKSQPAMERTKMGSLIKELIKLLEDYQRKMLNGEVGEE